MYYYIVLQTNKHPPPKKTKKKNHPIIICLKLTMPKWQAKVSWIDVVQIDMMFERVHYHDSIIRKQQD